MGFLFFVVCLCVCVPWCFLSPGDVLRAHAAHLAGGKTHPAAVVAVVGLTNNVPVQLSSSSEELAVVYCSQVVSQVLWLFQD